MKGRGRLILTVAMLALAGGLYFVQNQRQEIASAATRTRAALHLQIQERARIALLRKEISVRRTRLAAAGEVPATVSAGPADSPGDLLARDPNLQALRTRWFAAEGRLDFGPCFQVLGLSPSQITAVCARMVQYQAQIDELGRTQHPGSKPPAADAPLDPAAEEIVRRYREAARDYESDLAALLGTDGFKTFTDYRSAQQLWLEVGNLAATLYATDAPLSAGQSQQLIQAMKMHAQSPSGYFSTKTIDEPAVLKESADFLSPAQLAILARQLETTKLWISL